MLGDLGVSGGQGRKASARRCRDAKVAVFCHCWSLHILNWIIIALSQTGTFSNSQQYNDPQHDNPQLEDDTPHSLIHHLL